MSGRKRGLGRGIDALLGGLQLDSAPPLPGARAPDQLRTVPVEFLHPSPLQPRKEIDPTALQELADSIRAQGVLQPVLVRQSGPDRYEIIAGERRWRATQLAGLHQMPVLVREIDDRTALAIALIENLQRQDLTPLEEAEALHRLLTEHELTHQQLAEAIGKSRATVTNLLRLNGLHPEVKDLLQSGALEMGHARALLALSAERQPEAARTVVARRLTVRATERLVAGGADTLRPAPRKANPDVERLQSDMQEHLGTAVRIRHGRGGQGQIVIRYTDLDHLQSLLARLRDDSCSDSSR